MSLRQIICHSGSAPLPNPLPSPLPKVLRSLVHSNLVARLATSERLLLELVQLFKANYSLQEKWHMEVLEAYLGPSF